MSKDKVSLSDALRYVEEGETDHEDWQVVAEALAREIASLTHQRDSLAEDRNNLRKVAEQRKKMVNSLRDEVDQLRPERDRLRETLRQVTERAEHLQIENEGLSVERRQAHEENGMLRATLRHAAPGSPIQIPDTAEPTLGQIRDGLKVFVDWIEQDPGNLAFMEERDNTITRLREHLQPTVQEIRDESGKSWWFETRLDGPPVYHEAPDHDPVKRPSHYTSHPSGVECFDIVEHMSFCLGSAVKYIWRADLKGNAIQDLEKAIQNIEREISRIRRKANEPVEGLDY